MPWAFPKETDTVVIVLALTAHIFHDNQTEAGNLKIVRPITGFS